MRIEELTNILAEGIDRQKINLYTTPIGKCMVAHFGERAVVFSFNESGVLAQVLWNSFTSSCQLYGKITAHWEKGEEKDIFRIADNKNVLLIDNEYTKIV
jgi:hypothetical protein